MDLLEVCFLRLPKLFLSRQTLLKIYLYEVHQYYKNPQLVYEHLERMCHQQFRGWEIRFRTAIGKDWVIPRIFIIVSYRITKEKGFQKQLVMF